MPLSVIDKILFCKFILIVPFCLLYLIAFEMIFDVIISEVLSQRSKLNSKITNFFEFDKEFLETLDTFANDFKQDHNFVIFQGKELLEQRAID